MYRIAQGDSRGLRDVEHFIDFINDLPSELEGFFDNKNAIFIARAPGRLDVMGGIADYSGSLVLEMPIVEATLAAVQKSDHLTVGIRSWSGKAYGYVQFDVSLPYLQAASYDESRSFFSADKSNHWASYVAGVFTVLARECGTEFQTGARILISSDVPPGKGVSSSAALEVSTMQAVCAAFGITIEPCRMALLCQKVENLIVGAPCGVMDQITSHCGIEHSLTPLLCQPAGIKETIEIPEGIEFWGIDSGVRHAVTGSDYTAVRTAAFMGYRLIAELAGLNVTNVSDGYVAVDDERWRGYLSNITPAEYERNFASKVPEAMNGTNFLAKYGGITDTVTKVDPENTYPVRAATEFPIYENSRSSRFAELLKSADVLRHIDSLGALMFESHAGYSACGLTEPGTDRIVELVREKRDQGLYGARITGGGSGGTVAIIATTGAGKAIAEITRQYAEETGREPYIFNGSSPGCVAFGHLTLAAT